VFLAVTGSHVTGRTDEVPTPQGAAQP
jgi:hypothetical protein